MKDEIVEVLSIEDLQAFVPFLIHLPNGIEPTNVTYRKAGSKWATLRFECKVGDDKFRVKEFFLDWFYPGFPKSLMNSFVSTYSDTVAEMVKDRIIFYGKNYKGKDASSSYSLGTQIEIEGGSLAGVRKISQSMEAPFVEERFADLPFHKRSFFANGGRPEWFEEERIASLSWCEPEERLCVEKLCLDSIGFSKRDEKVSRFILVFSERYYSRAAWVEIYESGDRDNRFVYDLRKGGNFFDHFYEGNPIVASRGDQGPSISRFTDRDSTITVSLSPVFQLREAISVMEGLKDAALKKDLSKFLH